jgi:hypothetical protein
MKKETIHINLWAGPGVGKSGVSGELFGKFKANSYDCEMVREYAKDLEWSGTLTQTEQLIISAEQFRRENVIDGKVDIAIVDTCLLAGVMYCPLSYQDNLLKILKELSKKWKSHHYFLERNLNIEYETNGRQQTLSESIEIDFKLKKFLKQQKLFYRKVPVHLATERIFKDISFNITNKNKKDR